MTLRRVKEMALQPVFDGHNDLLSRLWEEPATREAIWLKGEGGGHLSLPQMQQGGFVGGFFAIWVPSESHPNDPPRPDMNITPYDVPLPRQITAEKAMPIAMAQAGQMLWMERSSQGQFRICRSVAQIRETIAAGAIAGILHMEGVEALDTEGDALHAFYEMGLRSLGPVWSRNNAFAHGVPFRFPSDGDIGPGLTEAGKRLVRDCNKLGILIDLSHLNVAGFNDVAALSDAPLVATHSNACAITPSSRNLTDRQLAVIRESKGMVGLNFGTIFLRPDGKRLNDMTLEPMLRHLDHLITHLGEDHVGFGSDFDGTTIPAPLKDATDLPKLVEALRAHGYDDALLAKLCQDNWLAVLERTWGK